MKRMWRQPGPFPQEHVWRKEKVEEEEHWGSYLGTNVDFVLLVFLVAGDQE